MRGFFPRGKPSCPEAPGILLPSRSAALASHPARSKEPPSECSGIDSPGTPVLGAQPLPSEPAELRCSACPRVQSRPPLLHRRCPRAPDPSRGAIAGGEAPLAKWGGVGSAKARRVLRGGPESGSCCRWCWRRRTRQAGRRVGTGRAPPSPSSVWCVWSRSGVQAECERQAAEPRESRAGTASGAAHAPGTHSASAAARVNEPPSLAASCLPQRLRVGLRRQFLGPQDGRFRRQFR